MCVFDKFHLSSNFKSRVSRDVFKNKNEYQLTSTFSFKCHLNVICLIVRVISFCEASIDVSFFFLHKSHYVSKSKLCVSIDVHFIFVRVFACQISKTCKFFCQKHTLITYFACMNHIYRNRCSLLVYTRLLTFLMSAAVHAVIADVDIT